MANLSDLVKKVTTVKYNHLHRHSSGAAESLLLETIAAIDECNASSIIMDGAKCEELIYKLVK